MTPVFCKTPDDQAKVLEAIGSKETPIDRNDMVLVITGSDVTFTHLSGWDDYTITSEEYFLWHSTLADECLKGLGCLAWFTIGICFIIGGLLIYNYLK